MRHITRLIIVITFSVLIGLAVFATLHPEPAKAGSLQPTPPDSAQTDTITDTRHIPVEGVDYIVIEQDIQVPPDYYTRKALGPAAAWKPSLWTNGQIPYEYDANVTAVSRTLMLNAMNEWQSVANVQFNQCASNTCGSGNYLHIQHSSGNNSAVGMIGGQQVVNIVSWNTHYIIAHELGHALGYWHEQSRSDRDLFVTINSANIQPGQASQFQIESNQVRYGPYDFDSVMHYDQCAFSVACPIGQTCACGITTTITVKPPNEAWQTLIGQRTHLSYLDKTTMSFLYPYPGWVFVDAAYGGTPSGSFGAPFVTVAAGYAATPDNGTLIVQPGNYSAVNIYNRPMTIRAPLGNVTLGQ
jgi:hypothetical protein